MSASVSAEEVARFAALAPRWWDARGPMRPLHQMNALRTGFIADRINSRFPQPGTRVLDLGCGGGIASEALARHGFNVTGVDAAQEAIDVARLHAAQSELAISYRCGLAEDLAAEGLQFPAVTALEIIEHVPDQAAFIHTLARLVAPGGLLFVSTLNRTWQSLAVAKIGAEYVARVLPIGTHDWRMFVKPEELAGLGRAAGLSLLDVSGMVYAPAKGGWAASRDTAINYIVAFSKA